jgi:hypothetical protein
MSRFPGFFGETARFHWRHAEIEAQKAGTIERKTEAKNKKWQSPQSHPLVRAF